MNCKQFIQSRPYLLEIQKSKLLKEKSLMETEIGYDELELFTCKLLEKLFNIYYDDLSTMEKLELDYIIRDFLHGIC